MWEISFNRETRVLTKIIKLTFLFVSATSLSWILSHFSQICSEGMLHTKSKQGQYVEAQATQAVGVWGLVSLML